MVGWLMGAGFCLGEAHLCEDEGVVLWVSAHPGDYNHVKEVKLAQLFRRDDA